MKILTLRQPWASLIGVKTIETRGWKTDYRGLIAFHSSNNIRKEEKNICRSPQFKKYLYQLGYRDWSDLPLGQIVATAFLVDCKLILLPNSKLFLSSNEMYPPGGPELDFGNYAPGRYGWILENIERVKDGKKLKGSLGLWEAEI
jgi:hypothetical protein